MHFLLQVVQTKLEIVLIFQEASVAKEELWGEFFVVWENIEDVLPGNVDVMKDLIGRSSYRFVLYFQNVAWNFPD